MGAQRVCAAVSGDGAEHGLFPDVQFPGFARFAVREMADAQCEESEERDRWRVGHVAGADIVRLRTRFVAVSLLERRAELSVRAPFVSLRVAVPLSRHCAHYSQSVRKV